MNTTSIFLVWPLLARVIALVFEKPLPKPEPKVYTRDDFIQQATEAIAKSAAKRRGLNPLSQFEGFTASSVMGVLPAA